MDRGLTILISLSAGALPAIFWLWFWLKEDRANPEPKRKIIASFLAGSLAVVVVLPIERYLYQFLGPVITVFTIFSWALAEEVLKFIAAYFSSFFHNKDYNEPIDALMYLISAALGFSAIENSLFLLDLIDSNQITQSIMSGNMRFVGATLLHTVSSASIGLFMSFGFYKSSQNKRLILAMGLIVATVLHTIFNLLIINNEENLFLIFSGVWFLMIILIFIFEKIKTIRN